MNLNTRTERSQPGSTAESRVVWTMLQRFWVAMVDAERKSLSGNVEVDEAMDSWYALGFSSS